MRRLSFVAATAFASLLPVAAAVPPRGGTFDPHINRHTGEPHLHAGEIARRLRQEVQI